MVGASSGRFDHIGRLDFSREQREFRLIINDAVYTLTLCYCVSFQWTTDQDITDVITGLGINDLVEIKFYENRVNGQSKG